MSSDLMDRADRALAAGRLDEAEQLCGSILQTAPDDLSALLLLGVVKAKQQRFEEALALLRRVEDEDRSSWQAPLWVSRSLRKLGMAYEALSHARLAVERGPENPSVQHQLGLCLLEVRRYDEAVTGFRQAIEADPNVGTLHQGLGLALQGSGRNSEAVQAFRRAIELSPNSMSALSALFQALMDESDSSGAVECARTMLTLHPGSERHLRLARALASDNNPAEAEVHLNEAQRTGPANGQASFAIGTILQAMGRFDEADTQFRRSIELLPGQGAAYSALAYNRKVGESDRPLVEQMKRLCEQGGLAAPMQSQLHYGLGKSLEDLGDYEGAMAHFNAANRLSLLLKFGDRPFDRKLYSDRFGSAIESAERELLEKHRDAGSTSDVPIFVIGMLRSGTTLADQILSSHPEVGSAGEQGFWLQNRHAAGNELRQLADSYLATLARIAPGKRHVIDKMPDNYLELPRIHLAFPNAKIIHMTRHAIDTCISIYTTINRLSIDWAHDRANIVFAYQQYRRLMEHWRRLLPEGTMLEVRYEELVSDPERVTREMACFCNLEWDDAFLYPEDNERTVATPSAWQVRQPLYLSSIDRWRRYEPWLGVFRELV